MKTSKHDTSLLANAMDKAIDLDNKAAGWLSSTDLYRITTAALEGHVKQCLAYQALSNNYTSLICSSNLIHCIHKATCEHIGDNSICSQEGISIFLFPERFSEISWRDLTISTTSFPLQLI
jgi:hypothetical protein